MGVIDVEAPSALLAVSGADIVLLAVPVAATEATLKAIRHLVTDKMLIMDVGSTKRDVIDAARRVLRDHVGSFVPCHPVTGKEVSGVEHADPDLYAGKQVILTPIDRTDPAAAAKSGAAVGRAGLPGAADDARRARRRFCGRQPPAPPDRLRADQRASPRRNKGKDFLSLAGPGFRDFTRIAASDPKMWRDILLANRNELLAQSKLFQDTLQAMEAMIESGDGDALEGLIDQASQTRANWRMGPTRK